jgi:hypothetical protein
MSADPFHSRSSMLMFVLVAALVLVLGYQLIAAGSAVGAPPGPQPGPAVRPTNTPLVIVPTKSVPTPAPAAPQARAQTPAAPTTCGPITDFEQFGAWKRGTEPNGTFTQSAELAHSGQFSGKLAYDFPTSGNDYVVFMRTLPIGGRPAALTAWVFGDSAGHYLNVWIKDASGEVWSFTFGQIRHSGWQQMIAPLNINAPWPAGHVSGPSKGTLDYPLSLAALVLDDAPDTYIGSGAIYIDDLSCSESVPVVAGPLPGAGAVGGPDRIAFAAVGSSGSSEIFTINPDGSGLAQLTNNRGFDGSPVWSPDGSRILYQCCSDVNCATDLCLMNADGSNPQIVARSVQDLPGREARPAWSPDGSRIAYTGQNPQLQQATSIFIASADGSNPQWLTGGRDPSWSPDGARIAFADSATSPAVTEVLVTNVDGTGLHQLTHNGAGTSDFPSWAPEGGRLAYCLRGKSLGDDGLHIINADGSDDRHVSTSCMWGLDWSRDGQRLTTSSFDSILVLGVDGGNTVALAKGREPSWSKTGAAVVSAPLPSQQPFGPIVFSSAFDAAAEQPLNAGKSFPSGTTQIYAVWPYRGVSAGTPFRFEWYVNGAFWYSGEDAFKKSAGNAWQSAYMPDGSALPPGSYSLVVKVGGLSVLTDQVVILNPGEPGGPPPPIVSGGASRCRLSLVEPSDESSFGEHTQNVILRWQLDRALNPNEYFFVNVPFPHGGTTWYDGTWRDPSQQQPSGTQDTQLTLRDYLCMEGFSDTGWYNWYVEVRQQLGANPGQTDPVQCKSDTWAFNWSGCHPTPTPTKTPHGPYD